MNPHGTWWGYPPGRAGSVNVVFCILSLLILYSTKLLSQSSKSVITPSLPVPAFASLPASTIPLSLPRQAAPIPSSFQQPPSLSPGSSLPVVLDLEDGLAPETLDSPTQHANGRSGKGPQAETGENGQETRQATWHMGLDRRGQERIAPIGRCGTAYQQQRMGGSWAAVQQTTRFSYERKSGTLENRFKAVSLMRSLVFLSFN